MQVACLHMGLWLPSFAMIALGGPVKKTVQLGVSFAGALTTSLQWLASMALRCGCFLQWRNITYNTYPIA